eukprot:GFUD01024445.1.p1 GENE.GFUD01024445.1~~GFUD01024445.1.p1  ORF type:complete len:369 (-),score=77.51 GFUD01024445.1:207-1280(-)
MGVTLQVFFGLLIGSQFVLGDPPASTSELRESSARDGKSLFNTFPFNQNQQNQGEHHAHAEEHDTANVATADTTRDAKQGAEVIASGIGFAEVAAVRPGRDGKKCIDKVEMVTETEYDDVVQCDHSYDKRCHTSYVTTYESQQEEECDENFRKTCYIKYEKIAFNETVNICRTPLVKDCSITGPKEICRTEYESECWTKQEEHDVVDDVPECRTEFDTKCDSETSGYTTSEKCSKWPKEVCTVTRRNVKKYTPITGCTKEPRQLCAPAGCGFKPAPFPECYDKVQTIIQDAPKEECTLEPQRTCKFVTKLVPKLEPREECVDVPKEVCTRSRTNPRQIQKPVIKKWCYIPSEESGLA